MQGLAGVALFGVLAANAVAEGPYRSSQPQPVSDRMVSVERGDASAPDHAHEARRQSRMSPEERRQLRRDVHDAGRDLYRDRPPRRESRQEGESR